MANIKSKDTGPEIILRKALWAKGLRYKVQYGNEKLDIAFPAKKLAIFVDGCFWHGCPLHSHSPKSNQTYWLPKLKKNVERDSAKNERLKNQGWVVMRFWEHELKDLEKVIEQVETALHSSSI